MNISIISPAGIVDKSKCDKGSAFLQNCDYTVFIGDNLYKSENWTAGTPEQRAADFETAWCDPNIDIVMCARGGFGSIHIIDLFDWAKLRKFNKVLCGHSDITCLHLAFLEKNIKYSVSGAMPAVELAAEEVDELTASSLISSLHRKMPDLKPVLPGCRVLKKGSCQGRLVPVTLSVMCSLAGTEYMPDLSGDILVLEDVNEDPYRLDAYLSQLLLCGVLESVGGVVYADFSGCGNRKKLDYLFAKFNRYIRGPVVEGLPFGHCRPRLSLPVGLEARLIAEENVKLESV